MAAGWTELSIVLSLVAVGLAAYGVVANRLWEKYGPIRVKFALLRVEIDVGIDAGGWAEVRNRTIAPRSLKFELRPVSPRIWGPEELPVEPLRVELNGVVLPNNEFELPPGRTASFAFLMRGKTVGTCKVRIVVVDADRFWREYKSGEVELSVSPTFTHTFMEYEMLARRLYGEGGYTPEHPTWGKIVPRTKGQDGTTQT